MTRKSWILLLVVLFVLFLGLPAFGPHSWGYWNFSPAGLVLAVLVIVILVGAV